MITSIKQEQPKCDDLARKASATFPPLDVVRGAVILVTQPDTNPTKGQKREKRETPPIELSPANLRSFGKTGRNSPLSQLLIDSLDDKTQSFKIELDKLTKLLRYDSSQDANDPGMPAVMLSRLSVTSWLPPLAWLIKHSRINGEELGKSEERKRILRYVLTNHFFADWYPDEAAMLRDLLNYVMCQGKNSKPFPEVYEIRNRLAAYKKPNSNDAPSWLRKVDDSQASDGRLVLPLTPEEWKGFLQRWVSRNNGSLPDTRTYGGLLPGLADDLLMWSQRRAMDEWFEEHAKDIALFDKLGQPWDIDHIVPGSFFDGRSVNLPNNDLEASLSESWPEMSTLQRKWHSIQNIANRFGNKRLWPLGFNRRDRDIPAGEKLAKDRLAERSGWEVLSKWGTDANSENPLLPASCIDENQMKNWTATPNKEPRKPITWDQAALKAFLEASIGFENGREIRIYSDLFKVLEPGLQGHSDLE